jgi:hypothetical protein
MRLNIQVSPLVCQKNRPAWFLFLRPAAENPRLTLPERVSESTEIWIRDSIGVPRCSPQSGTRYIHSCFKLLAIGDGSIDPLIFSQLRTQKCPSGYFAIRPACPELLFEQRAFARGEACLSHREILMTPWRIAASNWISGRLCGLALVVCNTAPTSSRRLLEVAVTHRVASMDHPTRAGTLWREASVWCYRYTRKFWESATILTGRLGAVPPIWEDGVQGTFFRPSKARI